MAEWRAQQLNEVLITAERSTFIITCRVSHDVHSMHKITGAYLWKPIVATAINVQDIYTELDAHDDTDCFLT